MTIGIPLKLESDRYTHVAPVPLIETGRGTTHGGDPQAIAVKKMEPRLVRHIAEFDIGIAPLADAPFNASRSNIKLKEYASAGTPWLASALGPYLGMGEKQGGRLVGDGDWYSALMRLIDRPRERKKLAKRALKWVAGETLEDNLSLWEDALTAAMRRAHTRRRAA